MRGKNLEVQKSKSDNDTNKSNKKVKKIAFQKLIFHIVNYYYYKFETKIKK